MGTLKFKTNIKCGGCIAAVKPHLNQLSGIKNWQVDTVNPDKILTIDSDGLSAREIIHKIQNAGYTAELI